jgi:hypothetical protein
VIWALLSKKAGRKRACLHLLLVIEGAISVNFVPPLGRRITGSRPLVRWLSLFFRTTFFGSCTGDMGSYVEESREKTSLSSLTFGR